MYKFDIEFLTCYYNASFINIYIIYPSVGNSVLDKSLKYLDMIYEDLLR
jgi:hypothetical protein